MTIQLDNLTGIILDNRKKNGNKYTHKIYPTVFDYLGLDFDAYSYSMLKGRGRK